MRAKSFTLALTAAALESSSALAEIISLGNNWTADFDLASCGLKIRKHVRGESISQITMFESDEHLLSTGKGNVDDITIMVNGNINKFP